MALEHFFEKLERWKQENKYWEFEKKWRYKVSAFSDIGFNVDVIDIKLENTSKKEIFIPIKRNIEEIMLGLKTKEDDYKSLDSFLNTHNYDIELKKSAIKIR